MVKYGECLLMRILLKEIAMIMLRSFYKVSKYYTPLFETLRNEGLALDDLDAVLSTFIRVPN